MQGSDEHRSERIPHTRSEERRELTGQMGRIRGPREACFVGWIGAEEPDGFFGRTPRLVTAGRHGFHSLRSIPSS